MTQDVAPGRRAETLDPSEHGEDALAKSGRVEVRDHGVSGTPGGGSVPRIISSSRVSARMRTRAARLAAAVGLEGGVLSRFFPGGGVGLGRLVTQVGSLAWPGMASRFSANLASKRGSFRASVLTTPRYCWYEERIKHRV